MFGSREKKMKIEKGEGENQEKREKICAAYVATFSSILGRKWHMGRKNIKKTCMSSKNE